MKIIDRQIKALRATLAQYKRWRKSGVKVLEGCPLCKEFKNEHTGNCSKHCPNMPLMFCVSQWSTVKPGPIAARTIADSKGCTIDWRKLSPTCQKAIACREKVHRDRLKVLLKKRKAG